MLGWFLVTPCTLIVSPGRWRSGGRKLRWGTWDSLPSLQNYLFTSFEPHISLPRVCVFAVQHADYYSRLPLFLARILSVWICVWVSVCLALCMYNSVSLCLSTCLSPFACLCFSACLFLLSSVYLSVCSSAFVFIVWLKGHRSKGRFSYPAKATEIQTRRFGVL